MQLIYLTLLTQQSSHGDIYVFSSVCRLKKLIDRNCIKFLAKNAGSKKIYLTILKPEIWRQNQKNYPTLPPPPLLGLACVVNEGKERLSGRTSVADSQICSRCLQPKVKIWKNRNVIGDNRRAGPLWLTRSWSRPILDKIGANGWAASARGLPNMSLPEMNLQIETKSGGKLRKIETERLCQKSHLSWEQSPVAV